MCYYEFCTYKNIVAVSTEFTLLLLQKRMSKIYTLCVNCGKEFYRAPAFHRHAESRGSSIKFCSRKCTDAARSKSIIGTKITRGKELVCEICRSSFYRPLSMIAAGKSRFCSEPCRLKAHELKLIDRTQPRPQNLKGYAIQCVICGDSVYRKKSMIVRNINKTCGKIACVSAYSRSLWKLPPRDKETIEKPRAQRKYRKNNFTAKQRADWIDTKCAYCGSEFNLSLDHIIAVCRGGLNTRDNAQTLCQPCNNWKAQYVDRLMYENTSEGGFQS